MNNKRFISDIVTIVLFLAVIFGFAVSFVVMPDEARRDYEAGIQTFPEADVEAVIHGSFATDMDKYFCDQFPLRKEFITLKALAERCSYRSVNNGILYVNIDRGMFGDVDYYVATRFNAVGVGKDTEFYSREHVESTLSSLKTVIEAQKVPVDVMLPPKKVDVIGPYIGYPTGEGDALNAQAAEILGDYYVDVMDALRGVMDENMQPYFSTDHHWTPVGSFFAFQQYMLKWSDLEPEFESYDYHPVKMDFLGTSARIGNYFDSKGEVMDRTWFNGYDKMKVEMGSNLAAMKDMGGLYNEDALNSPDPFNYYLHGKTKYVRITAPDEDRGTILVAKDSFAHILVPHLIRYYNVVMVDIDLFDNGFSLSAEVEKTGAERVLILYNTQNVIENSQLAKIRQ